VQGVGDSSIEVTHQEAKNRLDLAQPVTVEVAPFKLDCQPVNRCPHLR
jgi:hypothetical protein